MSKEVTNKLYYKVTIVKYSGEKEVLYQNLTYQKLKNEQHRLQRSSEIKRVFILRIEKEEYDIAVSRLTLKERLKITEVESSDEYRDRIVDSKNKTYKIIPKKVKMFINYGNYNSKFLKSFKGRHKVSNKQWDIIAEIYRKYN